MYLCACVYVVIYCVGWKMSLELFMKFQNRTNFLFALVITWLQSFLLQLAFVIFVTHQNTNSQIELWFTSTNFGEIGLKTCPLMTSWILDLLMWWGILQNSRLKFKRFADSLLFEILDVRVIYVHWLWTPTYMSYLIKNYQNISEYQTTLMLC